MRDMTMKEAISMTRLVPVVIAVALLLTATAYAAAPGITGPTFNLTAQPAYLNQPDGEAVYSWGYGCNGTPSGFAPAAMPNADLPIDAGSRPHADRPRRRYGHGEPAQRTSHRGRQHLDSVSWLSGDGDGRRSRPADAGGGAWRHSDVHVYCLRSGHARLLQRHARRPAGRDGLVRRHYCASDERSRRTAQPATMPRTWLRRSTGAKRISGCRRPPTTTPEAATTGSTCSSSPRWIPEFTAARRRRRSGTAKACAAATATEPRDAASTYRPSLTIPPTS